MDNLYEGAPPLNPAKGTRPLGTPFYFFGYCARATAKKKQKGVQRGSPLWWG